jgi:hypothetical protein
MSRSTSIDTSVLLSSSTGFASAISMLIILADFKTRVGSGAGTGMGFGAGASIGSGAVREVSTAVNFSTATVSAEIWKYKSASFVSNILFLLFLFFGVVLRLHSKLVLLP